MFSIEKTHGYIILNTCITNYKISFFFFNLFDIFLSQNKLFELVDNDEYHKYQTLAYNCTFFSLTFRYTYTGCIIFNKLLRLFMQSYKRRWKYYSKCFVPLYFKLNQDIVIITQLPHKLIFVSKF